MAKQRDPIQGEFFNTDSITTLARKITREGIGQNPMDAAPEGSKTPVRVRVFVSGAEGALAPAQAREYTRGLEDHVAKCEPAARPLFDLPCHFLVVEDFNTTGLQGDPAATEEPPQGVPNDFFYFFRAEGKSGKTGDARGRWGVGKYVFPMASRVNSFFALTVRLHDTPATPYLMGQAVLKNHELRGERYEPDGWWAQLNAEKVPIPFTDESVIDAFQRAWQVARRDEPGLSIVVPYVDEELTVPTLRASVVSDYYLAVLAGKLVVDIASAENKHDIRIDETSLDAVIDDLADASEREELRKNIALARWHLAYADEECIRVGQVSSGTPGWSQDLISAEDRVRVRDALNGGRTIAVRVPVEVRTKGTSRSEATWSYFDVVYRPEPGWPGVPVFVREGLIVPEVRSSRVPGIRTFVLVNDPQLAQMVGDAEGPAHANWSSQSQKFSGKYTYGSNWLAMIKRAPAEILKICRADDEDSDPTLLAQFFPLPTAEEAIAAESDSPRPGDEKVPPVPDIPPAKPRNLRISKIKGGFSVHLTETGRPRVTRIVARAAYDRRRGNPFKRWQSADFDFQDSAMAIEAAGGRVEACSGNQVTVVVDDAETFALHVRGFDEARDLRVHAAVVEKAT